MNKELTQIVLAAIAAAKQIPVDEISLEASLEDLEIDSLDAIGIITDLESSLNMEISNEDAAALASGRVQDIVEGLENLMAKV